MFTYVLSVSVDRCRYLAVFGQAYIYQQGKINHIFSHALMKQCMCEKELSATDFPVSTEHGCQMDSVCREHINFVGTIEGLMED